MKRILLITGLLLIVFLTWYLALKPSDYNIYFNATTSSGHAYDELVTWGATGQIADESEFYDEYPYREITQDLVSDKKSYRIRWSLDRLNDSTTRIKAGISEPGNGLINRLSLPFAATDFEKNTLEIVRNFKDFLEESIGRFRIRIEGNAEIPAKFCACTHGRTTPEKKAFKMMRDYSYLSGFIASNNLEPDGRPMIDILQFDEADRIIEFDFCFPFIKKDSLPESPDIFFKEIKSAPALKSTFHGDYRFSNKSWYRMFDYAEQHGMSYEKKPLEIYHNNPNMGGNTMEWTTEIYLPVKSF